MDKFKLYKKWFWIGLAVGILNPILGFVYGIALVVEKDHRKEGIIIIIWTILWTIINYYGIIWKESHHALAREGCFMLTIRQFVDFILHLRNSRIVIDGNGKVLTESRRKDILYSILSDTIGRGELLNAYFKMVDKKLWIQDWQGEINHILDSSSLLNDTHIDLNSLNWQGLPTKSVKKGIYYYFPRGYSVASFTTIAGMVSLNCNADLNGSHSNIGVRAAKLTKK